MVSRFSDQSSNESIEQQRKKLPESQHAAKPPRRPMTSYNIFFLLERERIISGSPERAYTEEDARNIVALQQWKDTYYKRKHRKSHGIISFKDLSIVAAANWRRLDAASKQVFYDCAAIERSRHANELHAWRSNPEIHSDGNASTPNYLVETNRLTEPSPVANQENAYHEYSLDISLHKLTEFSDRMTLLSSAVPDLKKTVSSSDNLLTLLDRNDSLGTVGSCMGPDDSHWFFTSPTNHGTQMTETDDLIDHHVILEDDGTMGSFQDFWAV
jgi:hypothetical protein